jgi:hypothetical protein
MFVAFAQVRLPDLEELNSERIRPPPGTFTANAVQKGDRL